MKLNKAISKFKNLISGTDKKYEIKIYQKFIATLDDLKDKNLSEEQFRQIELELDSINIGSIAADKKKYYRKRLTNFMKFLSDEFSFITEGYYTGIGMVLGMSIGVGIGTSVFSASGSSIGIGLGMMLGMLIGAAMDAKATKENRVIRTKLRKA